MILDGMVQVAKVAHFRLQYPHRTLMVPRVRATINLISKPLQLSYEDNVQFLVCKP